MRMSEKDAIKSKPVFFINYGFIQSPDMASKSQATIQFAKYRDTENCYIHGTEAKENHDNLNPVHEEFICDSPPQLDVIKSPYLPRIDLRIKIDVHEEIQSKSDSQCWQLIAHDEKKEDSILVKTVLVLVTRLPCHFEEIKEGLILVGKILFIGSFKNLYIVFKLARLQTTYYLPTN